jgi:single-strand DNA-binding protein
MASLNKVFLMGNLTRDPELRYTPNGKGLCEFGVAVNRRFTTKDGEQRDETCFVDVTMWGRRAEVISEYFKKGSPIFIEGRL